MIYLSPARQPAAADAIRTLKFDGGQMIIPMVPLALAGVRLSDELRHEIQQPSFDGSAAGRLRLPEHKCGSIL